MDPRTLNKIDRLELKARLIVEGFLGGMHKSPFHGSSVEFAEHREYVAGDDLRHLDWKVYAKSDRYFIKQYEEETNLRVQILLDSSESMRYGSGQVSKFQYASYVAASLAHMVLNQRDTVGMTLFDDQIRKVIPTSNNMAHMRTLCYEIEHATQQQKTRLGDILHQTAGKLTRRSLIILISDMFGMEDEILSGIKHLRHNRHDVIVLQILDRNELTFPYEELTEFLGLEGYENLLVDPRPLQQAYIEEITKFNQTLRRACTQSRVDYVTIATDQMLDVALATYLATRSAKMAREGKRR